MLELFFRKIRKTGLKKEFVSTSVINSLAPEE